MNLEVTRREVIGTIAALGSAALIDMGGTAMAEETKKASSATRASVATGKHEVVPLPFDPKKLRGLSEQLLVSHHDNNYAGAIKNLNKVEEQLATITMETPGFVVAGLKERELTFTNSMILHELWLDQWHGRNVCS